MSPFCTFAFCGFMYVYGSLWSPVCNFDLLMNLLNIHFCFKDIRMFDYKVEKCTKCLLLLQPASRFVPFNGILSRFLCRVIMSLLSYSGDSQQWWQCLMSTSCSLGQPNNGNPLELKLNLYWTRFSGKKSRQALCARTTTQHGVNILPSHLYLTKVLLCSGSGAFTGLILESFKYCL